VKGGRGELKIHKITPCAVPKVGDTYSPRQGATGPLRCSKGGIFVSYKNQQIKEVRGASSSQNMPNQTPNGGGKWGKPDLATKEWGRGHNTKKTPQARNGEKGYSTATPIRKRGKLR